MEDEFLRDLRTIDWFCFLNFADIDSICEVFNSNVKNVAGKDAPFVTFKIKGKIEPWVTDDFLYHQREEFS